MEPLATVRRTSRFSTSEKLLAIALGFLAVISPLYVNRRPLSDSELDAQPIINLAFGVPLAVLVLILAIALSLIFNRSFTRTGRFSSSEKFVAIGLAFLAVISPLYIDRTPVSDCETDEEPIGLVSWLPLLLLLLILAIAMSLYLDGSFARFDPYWIHRVGGSSGGIIVILLILGLVIKCKAAITTWES